MNKKHISIIIVLVVALGLFGLAQTKDTTKGPIIIGATAPLSGDYAAAGDNHKKGILLAAEQYNKKHPNTPVKVVVEDDGFDPKKGLSAFRKLTTLDKADALIMVSTPVIDTLYREINKLNIPVTNFGVQTTGVSADNIYQMSPMGETLIAQYTDYLNTLPNKKWAVLYDNNEWGVLFFNSFKEHYTAGTYDSFKIGGKGDLKGYANRIAAGEYDSVLFLTSPEHGALTVKELQLLLKRPVQYLFDAQLQTGAADYKRILGDMKKLEGANSFWLKPGPVEEFTKAYKEKYGEEPGSLADFGYDAFNALMSTYDKDPIVWRKKLQDIHITGVSGQIAYDEKGIRVQDVMITKVDENGEIKSIK